MLFFLGPGRVVLPWRPQNGIVAKHQGWPEPYIRSRPQYGIVSKKSGLARTIHSYVCTERHCQQNSLPIYRRQQFPQSPFFGGISRDLAVLPWQPLPTCRAGQNCNTSPYLANNPCGEDHIHGIYLHTGLANPTYKLLFACLQVQILCFLCYASVRLGPPFPSPCPWCQQCTSWSQGGHHLER